MDKNILIAMLLVGTFLLASGCIMKVENQDKFSSDPTTYNFTRYLNASRNDPVNKTAPCTCMMCSVDLAAWTKYVPNFLLSDRYTNFSLITSTCNFVRCNQTLYNDILTEYIASGGSKCDIRNPLTGVMEKRLCGPRFFMLGQGADASEYARAQTYCNGQLKMPVTWAVPNATTGELDKNLSPSRMSCYMAKDQMPMVVWYSNGKYVSTGGYTKMVKMLNQTGLGVDGPIMVSTEALYYPYKADGSLDIARLDAVASQIKTIRKECPKCLSVLALKPTFLADNPQIPDLRAVDYILNISNMWDKVDIIGVGFMANENPNLTVCSPDTDVGRHLLYSREVLRRFYKPSVWYAVGIAAGPTATPDCEFGESEAGNAWESIIGNGPALGGSGVIGVAPYRFSDDPLKAPLNLTIESAWFNSTFTSLDLIRNPPKKTAANPNVQALVIVSSNDPNVQIGVDKYVPAMSGNDRAAFVGGDGAVYSARINPAGSVEIFNLTGRYGFQNIDGSWHNTSAYLWFSNCEYYSRNRGPQWVSDTSLDTVSQGATLQSTDRRYSIGVSVINSTRYVKGVANEILFYGDDGRPYAVRRDGNGTKLYDRPAVEQATVQPIVFPTNGRSGAQCLMFDSGKMYPRIGLRSNSEGGVYNLTLSKNVEDKKTISALSCGGAGGCLASSPMPKAFCKVKNRGTINSYFPDGACTQYPEMDEAFGDAPPLFMRAIAVGETSRFGNPKYPETGWESAACEISFGAGGCGGPQTANALVSSVAGRPSAYCTEADIRTKVAKVGENNLCAFGPMACTRSPTSTYNPFIPADSAVCGSEEFLSKNMYRYNGQLEWLQKQWGGSQVLQKEIASDELEWYAAWMAGYAYSGMGVGLCPMHTYVQNYQPSGPDSTLEEYVQDNIESCCKDYKARTGKDCYPSYGTNLILRYNNAIETCNADCPHTDC
ncbi:Uncharacterised protein [uncultured archaeon]|nr:Uncharacterised protein [uncultured archaeon]